MMDYLSRSGRLRAAILGLVFAAGASPAGAKPAQPRTARASQESEKLKDLKTQGEKAQRIAETRQRLWDRKMKAVSGSICRGC